MTKTLAALMTAALLLAGCSASRHRTGTSQTITAPSTDESSICTYLAHTQVLKKADVLSAQGADATSDQVSQVRDQLQNVIDVAPAEMQLSLKNIIDQVGTASIEQVVPDSRLLAGECRARGLPVPDTD